MRESVVIADSGPLIALVRIGKLSILNQLADRILIPPAVHEEVTVKGSGHAGSREIAQASWIEVGQPDPLLVETLRILVDAGEAEAIALARMHPENLLLLDDSKARRLAARLHVRCIGTVGLLRRAKLAGIIGKLRPHLDELKVQGIYIRQRLIDEVLRDVGE